MNTQQLPQLSIGEALKAACNKIFQFNGRSRRSEFWWTALVVIIICAITHDTISWLMNLLMIPITFRRLHDTGRSGWWWGAGIIATYGFGTIFVIDLGISSLIYKIPCSGVISRPAASTSCRSFFITSAGIHLRSTLTVRTRLRLRTMSIGA